MTWLTDPHPRCWSCKTGYFLSGACVVCGNTEKTPPPPPPPTPMDYVVIRDCDYQGEHRKPDDFLLKLVADDELRALLVCGAVERLTAQNWPKAKLPEPPGWRVPRAYRVLHPFTYGPQSTEHVAPPAIIAMTPREAQRYLDADLVQPVSLRALLEAEAVDESAEKH